MPHNPQPTTHRILENFNEFVSGAGEEGFGMVMGGKERVTTRLVGKRRERSESGEWRGTT